MRCLYRKWEWDNIEKKRKKKRERTSHLKLKKIVHFLNIYIENHDSTSLTINFKYF